MDQMSAHHRRLSILLDVMVFVIAFYITTALTKNSLHHRFIDSNSKTYYATRFFGTLSWIVTALLFGSYPVRRVTTIFTDIKIALKQCLLFILVFSAITFALKVQDISRGFLASHIVIAFVMMVLVRVAVRQYLGFRRRTGQDIKTRLIVGGGSRAITYIERVEHSPYVGIRIIGYLSERGERIPAPYLGEISQMRGVLSETPVDAVVIALPVNHPSIERVINECEVQGIAIEFLLDGLSARINMSTVVHGMGIPRLVMSTIPYSETALLWKRITDVIISSCLLTLLSPLFFIIMVAIRLDDKGPAIFSQERVGIRGRRFRMHKFRSMIVNAEDQKEVLLSLNEMSGPVFKLRNDPRITKIGRVLRKTSLDELPQLWDVLIGNMSLVGPRPPLPSEVNLYEAGHRKRLSVKPGITCLWQISGRNNVDFNEWMNLDLQYIDTWSYFNDWRILAKTVPAVLRRDGAV